MEYIHRIQKYYRSNKSIKLIKRKVIIMMYAYFLINKIQLEESSDNEIDYKNYYKNYFKL